MENGAEPNGPQWRLLHQKHEKRCENIRKENERKKEKIKSKKNGAEIFLRCF